MFLEISGFEPLTSAVQKQRSKPTELYPQKLIYFFHMLGYTGLEPVPSPLSGVRSNQAELIAHTLNC